MSIGVAVALAFGLGVGGLSADAPVERHLDAPDPPEITVFNAHLYGAKVYAVDAEGEDHILGQIGADEVASFDLPAEVATSRGDVRISVLPSGPNSGLGTRPQSNAMVMTRPFEAEPGKEFKIILDPGLDDLDVHAAESDGSG